VTLLFSPAANEDLLEIAQFIASDSADRALSFIDELETQCEALSRSPGIGTRRFELGQGVLMLPHGRYLIFYRQVEASVRIERVLHSARDIGRGDIAHADLHRSR